MAVPILTYNTNASISTQLVAHVVSVALGWTPFPTDPIWMHVVEMWKALSLFLWVPIWLPLFLWIEE